MFTIYPARRIVTMNPRRAEASHRVACHRVGVPIAAGSANLD